MNINTDDNYNSLAIKNQQQDIINNSNVVDNKDIEALGKKKKSNVIYYNYSKKYKSLSMQKRIKECGTILMFKANKDLTHKRLHQYNGCKDRMCPLCAGIKARKDAFVLSILAQYIKGEFDKEFVFLTLTTPNVSSEELNDTIKNLNSGFKRLVERKDVSKVIKGYARKLEITYNKYEFISKKMYYKNSSYYDTRGLKIGDKNPNFNTYHPHFHVLIAVNKSYFTDKTYIKHEQWIAFWRKSMRDDSITQVDVRKVSVNNSSGASDISAINETAKYSAKDSDYLHNEEVFDVFFTALKSKKVMAYNGLFKDAMTLYKQYIKIKTQTERESHVMHKYISKNSIEYIYIILYRWGYEKYAQHEIRELTEDEKKRLNRMALDNDFED